MWVPAAWKKRFGIRRVMIRITQTREMTKVRRNAMNVRRARCRRAAAACYVLGSAFFSSFQFIARFAAARCGVSHDGHGGQKRKSVVILCLRKISAKKAGQLFARRIRTG